MTDTGKWAEPGPAGGTLEEQRPVSEEEEKAAGRGRGRQRDPFQGTTEGRRWRAGKVRITWCRSTRFAPHGEGAGAGVSFRCRGQASGPSHNSPKGCGSKTHLPPAPGPSSRQPP